MEGEKLRETECAARNEKGYGRERERKRERMRDGRRINRRRGEGRRPRDSRRVEA